MSAWLSEDLEIKPRMTPVFQPNEVDIEAWLTECAPHLSAYVEQMSGSGNSPIVYGNSLLATDVDVVRGEDAIGGEGRVTAIDRPLNSILYGPPGTGKTFATIDESLAILDPEFLAQNPEHQEPTYAQRTERRSQLKKRFDELSHAGRVRFVTFHQSFSYEDFVEGIRAETSGNDSLVYPVVGGVFKELCLRAAVKPVTKDFVDSQEVTRLRPGQRIWKMSLGAADSDDAYVFDDCMREGLALLGFGHGHDYSECENRKAVVEHMQRLGIPSADEHYAATALNLFINSINVGDLIVVTDGNLKFRAIGEVTGPYQRIERETEDDYCQARPVRWGRLYRPSLGFGELMNNRFSQMTLYELRDGSIDLVKLQGLLEPSERPHSDDPQPYVMIIDEINRGNVSRIFGELITLIEPSKRAGASEMLTVTLPYSKFSFSVPSNVYLIGTMNTADRSLAGLDIALRRRFVFKEMPPQATLLNGVDVEGIDIGQLLLVMNERIEVLLDRDHLLGHSFFMELAEPGRNTLATLAVIFKNQVVPLLQEYFFDDWERVAWVLNDHRKREHLRFVEQHGSPLLQLFGPDEAGKLREKRWRINRKAFQQLESYREIFSTSI